MAQPRLLLLSHTPELGGAELALLGSIPALAKEFDLSAAVPGRGPLIERLRALGVGVIDTDYPAARLDHQRLGRLSGALSLGRGAVGYLRALRSEMSDGRPDLVYANTLKAAVVAALLAPSWRRPWVWHLRDRLEVGYLGRLPVVVLRWLASVGPSVIIANSEGTARSLPPRARRRTVVIPSPIDVERFAAAGRRRVQAALRPVIFVVVGRLTPVKGQHLVIEAFAEVDRHCDARLWLVGGDLTPSGQELRRLQQDAQRFGVQDHVRFLGHVDAVEDVLAQADVLVSYPVHPEPFGQAVIQAIAAGVCVVSASEGGPSEVIRDEVTGLLVPPRDPSALATAMIRLARDDRLRRRLAHTAQPIALGFDRGRTLPRLVTTLRRAARWRPELN